MQDKSLPTYLCLLVVVALAATVLEPAVAEAARPTVGGYAAARTRDHIGVNIRSGPSRDAAKIGAINEGDVVAVLDGPFYDDNGDPWFQIDYGGVTGYAIGKYLAAVAGPPAPPSVFQDTAADVGVIPVLMYHHIDYAGGTYSVTPEQLDAQCRWLVANGYTAITLTEFYNGAFYSGLLPARPVVLTIDDGWATAVDFANILANYGLVGNYFVNNTSEVTPDQLAYLGQVGEVADHTVDHAVLSQLSYDDQYAEIANNKAYLESVTGQTVQFLAWPYGDWNAGAVRAAAAAGILAAFDAWGGPANLSALDPWHIPRILISGDYDLDTFAAVVSG
jgi:peptidoglycan/xylan/chitin deacetylase (PgdA/CDA1 family)